MDKLSAQTPFDGLLPLEIGNLTLQEAPPEPMTSLMPYDPAAMGAALTRAHGLAFPAPNRMTRSGDLRCLWFGQNQALLIGAEPDNELAQYGAVVDQSDAWAVARLQGTGAEDVLARLVPVDLRLSGFAAGHCVRSQIGHMNAAITRLSPDTFEVMVFRSMAVTLMREMKRAMQSVDARA